ncbi:hypothetical protein [Microbulbifer variabilis]|uniref:hypothetical protein n=1 Tax=Microbulbifer variabilis TaxID=266805 RepID=UPI001CFEEB6E|nr:hypothetical protein [Microbulbifer variabilis]
MKFLITAMCFLFTGCAVNESSSCAFDLKSNGWSRVVKGVNPKIQPVLDSPNWYVNSAGDYLICFEVTSDGECNGIYEQFIKQQNGDFVNEEIVCME